MDLKIIITSIATILVVVAYFPYLRDIFLRRTQPHAYTWLIWSVTQITAVVGIWHGGGNLGGIALAAGTFFVVVVFLLSLVYGTKNVTRSDVVVLLASLVAILIWWQLDNPELAVLLASLINVSGFIPSIRKVYEEPWSETLSAFVLFTIGNLLSIFALSEYTVLTLSFLLIASAGNLVFIVICLLRRRAVPRSSR